MLLSPAAGVSTHPVVATEGGAETAAGVAGQGGVKPVAPPIPKVGAGPLRKASPTAIEDGANATPPIPSIMQCDGYVEISDLPTAPGAKVKQLAIGDTEGDVSPKAKPLGFPGVTDGSDTTTALPPTLIAPSEVRGSYGGRNAPKSAALLPFHALSALPRCLVSVGDSL